MQTEAIFFWDPTTCSNALIYSSASRPCVTSTRPIISSSFNESGVPKTFKFIKGNLPIRGEVLEPSAQCFQTIMRAFL